ncbi:MAG: aminotransferase class V-fold PLP-dependent enzyme [Bdellovibrionales bacterium]|nr:aminotransferase class V-fold PLP-dependent enzyme [Bdellovibrionales bacterium]
MSDLNHFKKKFSKENQFLHLNNAGLSPISLAAKKKICYWAEKFYQEGFFSDNEYMKEVQHSRESLAKLIGCDSQEIAFFQSTAGAISQLCFQFPLKPYDEVITWDQEYASNLYPWRESCRRNGAILKIVKSEDNFTTPVDRIIEQISDKTKAIAISWLQFTTGSKTDLAKLSEVTNQKNIFLFVDIIQGLGIHSFEMKKLGIDAVAGGSHKWLCSPVGVGYLAIDQKHIQKIAPHNFGAYTFGTCDDPTDLVCQPKSDALKYEAGSKQVLEITALGASVDLILEASVTTIEAEILRLSSKLAEGIQSAGYAVYYNNSSIVNFIPKQDTCKRLNEIHCSFAKRGPGVRLSPHAFNTDKEIDQIIKVLRD